VWSVDWGSSSGERMGLVLRDLFLGIFRCEKSGVELKAVDIKSS
jgi:hypothetical protein